MALNFNGRNEAVKIPISISGTVGNTNYLRNCRVRSDVNIALMVKLVPQFIPNIDSVLHGPKSERGIIRASIAAVELLPCQVIK